MEEEKKPVTFKHRPGLDERIRNTAELLAGFAKQNLDEKAADEIINDLSDIINKNED